MGLASTGVECHDNNGTYLFFGGTSPNMRETAILRGRLDKMKKVVDETSDENVVSGSRGLEEVEQLLELSHSEEGGVRLLRWRRRG